MPVFINLNFNRSQSNVTIFVVAYDMFIDKNDLFYLTHWKILMK